MHLMTAVSNRAATKRLSHATVTFPCAQCAVKIMAAPADVQRAVQDHVNLWHPAIVGPRLKLGARNVTPSGSLKSGTTGPAPR